MRIVVSKISVDTLPLFLTVAAIAISDSQSSELERKSSELNPSKAIQAGIVIEEGKQPIRGSPQDKAKELALSAYHERLARRS